MMKFKKLPFVLCSIFFIYSSIWGIDSKTQFLPLNRNPAPIDSYKIEVAYIIQKNWSVPTDQISARDNIVVSVAFKVMPDGTIKDVTITEASGNKALDDSAIKAVVDSNPVPPHPKSIDVPFIDMSIRFTPYGLK